MTATSIEVYQHVCESHFKQLNKLAKQAETPFSVSTGERLEPDDEFFGSLCSVGFHDACSAQSTHFVVLTIDWSVD